MIIPKTQIAAAVTRCLEQLGDPEAAIETVAQEMHLAVETVRECVEEVEA